MAFQTYTPPPAYLHQLREPSAFSPRPPLSVPYHVESKKAAEIAPPIDLTPPSSYHVWSKKDTEIVHHPAPPIDLTPPSSSKKTPPPSTPQDAVHRRTYVTDSTFIPPPPPDVSRTVRVARPTEPTEILSLALSERERKSIIAAERSKAKTTIRSIHATQFSLIRHMPYRDYFYGMWEMRHGKDSGQYMPINTEVYQLLMFAADLAESKTLRTTDK